MADLPPDEDLIGAPAAEEPSLTRRTISGLQWTYAQTGVNAVLQLAVAAVLARLLTPEAFGLVAIGDLTLRFVNYIARAGIAQAVVQKPDLDERDVRAAFLDSTGLSIVFFGVAWLIAPAAAALFEAPDAVPVLRWMALSLPLYGIGAVADGLLRRDLRFRAVALRDIASYVLGYGIVAMIGAAQGWGVWALVAATLTQTGSKSVLAFIARPHAVRPTIDRAAHRAVLGFGSRVSLISFFEFLGGELDTIAVGRFAGTSALGLYNRAYLIVRLPVYHLTTSLSKVLFPAFSAVQRETERLRSAYLGAVRVTAALVIPTAAGIAAAREEIVRVILGDQWLDAIPVLPWIAVASALGMITHFAALVAEAQAALNRKIVLAISKVVVLAALLAGASLQDELWAYGAALAGAALWVHLGYLLLIGRLLQMPARTPVLAYAPAVLAGAIVAGAISLARLPLVADHVNDVVVLVVEVLVGAIALPLMVRFGPLTAVRDEIGLRLHNAGLTSGSGRRARWARRLVGDPTDR